MEEVLWNHKMNGIPHGKQMEFFDDAVTYELDRLEGKNIDVAINELATIYAEIGRSNKVDLEELQCIDKTISILKAYKELNNATV